MPMGIDYLGNGKGQGDLAAYIMKHGKMNPGLLRPFEENGRAYVSVYVGGDPKKLSSYSTYPLNANATLRRDEWKALDEALLRISEKRLGGVQDLIDNGLVYNLGNAMGTTVLEYHDMSDAFTAELTMDGVTRSKNDRPEFSSVYLPIPIVHVDYEINTRVLEASRNLGNPLDTTSAERAGRKVNEKFEDMLFTNTTYTYGGGTIYSYLNHPDINEVSLSTHWNDSPKTAAQIIADVMDMKQAAIDAYHHGPYMLYIPTAYETVMDEDYNSTTPTTIRERIMKIGGIKGVKVIDTLPADHVLLVQMTSDVVRLVRGMGITNIAWKEEGQFVNKFKVIAIQVPQIRSDQDGNSGIVLLA